MKTVVELQWHVHVQCERHICPGASDNTMKDIYTSVPDHILIAI